MHIHDPFNGHFMREDDRTALYASHGCLFPSVPPRRFFIGAWMAGGALSFLASEGLILEEVPQLLSTTFAGWRGTYFGEKTVSIQYYRRYYPEIPVLKTTLIFSVVGVGRDDGLYYYGEHYNCNQATAHPGTDWVLIIDPETQEVHDCIWPNLFALIHGEDLPREGWPMT